MAQRSEADGGSAGLRVALGELLVRLRRAAVDGVVPEQVFVESVRTLTLGDAERGRLRHELARMGLPVRELHVHEDTDQRNGERVAQNRGENVFSRLRVAQNLLARYEDSDGYVTSRVVDGVARLAGLTAHEAKQLHEGALVRPPDGESDGEDDDADADEPPSSTDEMAAADPEPGHGGPDAAEAPAADVGQGDLADALAAAHAVLEADRHDRRPGNRLLSARAEVGLAVLVRGGADRAAQEPSDDELGALAPDDIRVRARDCLVLHNQRLVHSLVRPYLEQGLDYDDLAQHGFLGLLRATRKFDPTKGFKFSTYATWWIRQSITRGIADEGALIRVPVHMHEQMRKVSRAERTLAAEGRSANVADVAVACDMTLKKVEEIRRLTRRTDSLDRVIGDGATLADFVGRTHVVPSVEKQVLDALHLEAVMDVLDTFSEREHRILVRRLGLDGDEPSTLDELGRIFGVTRERIRQIEGKARPAFMERLRTAGLAESELDTVCAEAERAAEQAAEAARAARLARRRQAARDARVRHAARKIRAERAARAATTVHMSATEERAVVLAQSDVIGGAGGVVDSDAAADERAVATAEGANLEPTERASDGTVTGQGTKCGEPSAAATADWERARLMSQAPVDHVSWLAEYAVAAPEPEGLGALLGQPAADAVLRGDREGESLTSPVLKALEVLRRVLDAVVACEQRPEAFLDRPAEALRGSTPRSYLTDRPLVHGESRLAVRDALREFVAAREAEDTDDANVSGDQVTDVPEEVVVATVDVATTDPQDTVLPDEYEANEARLREEYEQRLAEHRQSADQRVVAARAEAEQELSAWEDVLLTRMDTVMARRERRIRAEAEQRVAQLKADHHEAYQAALCRAEAAEESLRQVEDRRDRTQVLELRLRQYRQGAESRIAELETQLWQARAALTQRDWADEDVLRRQREAAETRAAELEARLRDTEAALTQRDRAVEEARRHAETVEQQVAQRIARTEYDAWARITALQQQLAETQAGLPAAQEPAQSRGPFRDRWRRA